MIAAELPASGGDLLIQALRLPGFNHADDTEGAMGKIAGVWVRLREPVPRRASLRRPAELRQAAGNAAQGQRFYLRCSEQIPIGDEREVWTAERQLESLGLGELGRCLPGKRSTKRGRHDGAPLEDEPIARDRVRRVGKRLFGRCLSACLQLDGELLGGQRVEGLPLALERLKTEPQQSADGGHDGPEVQQDGASVQARRPVGHGWMAQRSTESRCQTSRIVTRRGTGASLRSAKPSACCRSTTRWNSCNPRRSVRSQIVRSGHQKMWTRLSKPE